MTDWLPELTDDDLNTLLEALEAWETKDTASEMFNDVMDVVMNERVTEKALEHYRAVRAQQKSQMARSTTVRKERSVLLRAKLLTLRERRRVEAIRP